MCVCMLAYGATFKAHIENDRRPSLKTKAGEHCVAAAHLHILGIILSLFFVPPHGNGKLMRSFL